VGRGILAKAERVEKVEKVEKVEREKGIKRQIELPFSEAVRISIQSIKIRFWRSLITTAGIFLGIAFFVSVLAGSAISDAMKKSEEITIGLPESGTKSGVSAQDIWLIVMSLIVCVVGIANAMLMAVAERFREIGTMKCLGALDWFVVELFLLESSFQGLSGAIAGSVVGCLITILLSLKDYGLDLFFNFPVFRVLLIIVVACVIGMVLAVLGAAGPAYRAAKLPPAEAMRVEI
jgi:ABC-type antimicrobial peptide transport system permease subunit